ncbi:MAG: hypothetical protein WCG45_00870 [bacterium]
MRRTKPRLNKYEKRALFLENKEKETENPVHEKGLYVYQNITNGNLELPRQTHLGLRTIGKGNQFEGSDYFMSLVGNPMNLLRVIKILKPKEENTMDKLILDQPETVTKEGQVEYVVEKENDNIQLNDSNTNEEEQNKDVLICENPLDGVEIILAD